MEDVNNQLFKGRAPDSVSFPYAVFRVITTIPKRNFIDNYNGVVVQFGLYSSTSETTQVENMFSHLKALYDECSMSITDETLIWFRRVNAVFQVEDHTIPSGTQRVWAWYVDYRIIVEV